MAAAPKGPEDEGDSAHAVTRRDKSAAVRSIPSLLRRARTGKDPIPFTYRDVESIQTRRHYWRVASLASACFAVATLFQPPTQECDLGRADFDAAGQVAAFDVPTVGAMEHPTVLRTSVKVESIAAMLSTPLDELVAGGRISRPIED
ncbi:MAG: hypothetical protein ABI142_04245, partial [Bryocella sp.]